MHYNQFYFLFSMIIVEHQFLNLRRSKSKVSWRWIYAAKTCVGRPSNMKSLSNPISQVLIQNAFCSEFNQKNSITIIFNWKDCLAFSSYKTQSKCFKLTKKRVYSLSKYKFKSAVILSLLKQKQRNGINKILTILYII